MDWSGGCRDKSHSGCLLVKLTGCGDGLDVKKKKNSSYTVFTRATTGLPLAEVSENRCRSKQGCELNPAVDTFECRDSY